jgi:hypothetical protein
MTQWDIIKPNKHIIMSVLDLYQRGIIGYLFNKGLVSGSTLAYVEYYTRYLEEREHGKKYRESVRSLSKEFRVSETTIKKAIKVVKDA